MLEPWMITLRDRFDEYVSDEDYSKMYRIIPDHGFPIFSPGGSVKRKCISAYSVLNPDLPYFNQLSLNQMLELPPESHEHFIAKEMFDDWKFLFEPVTRKFFEGKLSYVTEMIEKG